MLERYAEEIVKSKIDRLIISIDGLEEIHDDVRGVKGTFQRIIAGITKINSLKKIRPIISSNSVVTSKNYHKLYELMVYLKSLRINSMEIQFPMFFTEKMGTCYEERMMQDFNIDAKSWKGFVGDYHEIDIPLLIDQIEKIHETIPKHIKLVPNLSNEMIFEYFSNPEVALTDKTCSLPFSQISVEPNGDLVICPDFPDYVLGNMYNIEKAADFWDSTKINEFRDSLKERGLMPICSKCCQLYQF
jgi:radical SAM protein with 4Fe4S-binding SPASM domain